MANNSYIKQLKKAEVEQLLAKFGYKLHKDLFDDRNKPIEGYTKKCINGKYILYLRCKKINSKQNYNNLSHFFYHEVDGQKIKLDNAIFLIEDFSVKCFIGADEHSKEFEKDFLDFMTNKFGYTYARQYNAYKNNPQRDYEY